MTGPISRDDYMQVLVARQQAWHARNPHVKLPALYEWFIEDGDELYVIVPKQAPAPKKTVTPRVYRSAESLRAERDKLDADMARVAGAGDPGDRAATNLSPYSRSRAAASAGRRRFAQMDRALERYTAMSRRRDALDSRIAKAEAREARRNGDA
ncbi:hypothetical protein [Amycolatopsis antarctica]|uniref:hypothetical protein n=1 Tax=Amycolatopsis antarctica TaxID=1854586 RepID=UPI001055DEDC|nr:hypothetical protein [Amycolatopsis antarctica]